jgi:hypothetical protein
MKAGFVMSAKAARFPQPKRATHMKLNWEHVDKDKANKSTRWFFMKKLQ